MESLVLLHSVLRIHESNIRNLHWNATGMDFDDSHKSITEEYYELFASTIDEVAEIMSMLDIAPPNYIDVLGVIKASERKFRMVDVNRLYDRQTIVEYINDIFTDIVSLLQEVLAEDIIQNPVNVGIKAELESLVYKFDFQKRYINKRRLS